MSHLRMTKSLRVATMAACAVLMLAAAADAATDEQKFVKAATRAGSKTYCVCTNGTFLQDKIGTLTLPGTVDGRWWVACGIPSFNSSTGAQGLTTFCYDYTVLR